MKAEAIAVVLAGGRARRMGGAKAGVELAGRPLIEHVLDQAEAAGLEARVVAKPSTELPARARERLLPEPEEPAHPLLGLVTALALLERPVVALACDAPFVPAALIAELARREAPVVVVEGPAGMLPLPGRYTLPLAPKLAAALDRGLPLRRAVASVSPQVIGGEALAGLGDPELVALNVNDRHDLARAESSLSDIP